MDSIIGQKIKDLRTSKNWTLKDLGEKTGLSVGFLSQAERGLSSLGIISLKGISDALGVEISYFFTPPKKPDSGIIRSYEQEVFHVDETDNVYISLARQVKNKKLDPIIMIIPPDQSREDIFPYTHQGEEFVLVLEGTLTALIDEKEYTLYPGDSIHISSSTSHNWGNLTNKLVKILTVTTPPIFEPSS